MISQVRGYQSKKVCISKNLVYFYLYSTQVLLASVNINFNRFM